MNPIGIRLRELLLANPQGMTVREISKADGATQDLVISALRRNYGFYISDWQKVTTGLYRAVWSVVTVPAGAPKPMEYSECYDMKEALQQRKSELAKAKRLEESRKRALERKKAKLERDRIKAEEKQRKAEAKAAMKQIQLDVRKNNGCKKAGGSDYTPQMTQIRGPWPTEVHDARVH
jgi:hypothetical protein